MKTLAWEEVGDGLCLGYRDPYDDQTRTWAMKITNGVLSTGAPEPAISISETYGFQNYLKYQKLYLEIYFIFLYPQVLDLFLTI